MSNRAVPLEVAVAVIVRGSSVLIAKRPIGKKHEGLWEFPGGKFEPDEDFAQALRREIMEELGIEITSQEALMQVPHDYPEYSVNLRVALVTNFIGEPQGREGQEVAWVPSASLSDYAFPEANRAILQKLAIYFKS